MDRRPSNSNVSPQPAKPARVVLRAGTWYADDAPCSSYRDALTRTLRAAKVELRPSAPPERREPRRNPHAPGLSPDAPEARIVARGGAWYVEGERYPSFRAAMAAALEAADIGPQPGNSERGSRQVAEARLAWAKGAGA